MNETLAHPTPERLAAFVAGTLAAEEQQSVELHVAGCAECCRVLESLPADTLAGRLRTDAVDTPTRADTHPAPRSEPAEPPIPVELRDHPRYRVVRSVGGGGMGMVYLAEHRRMERPVVLKVIRPALLADPAMVRRFHIEVKAAARLSHPNIVQAYDADEAGNLHFLAMEYVEGVSLAKLIAKRGALPPAYACNYVRQAALGLQHAHEKGMVHRDIKPQNLMLTGGGQIKILDFGLAQFARDATPDAAGETISAGIAGRTGTIVTAAGAVFGTPDYIAPEQSRSSHDVDIRADIYALGCTLYFLLRGEPPFPHGTAHEKVLAHQTRPLPPLTTSANGEPLPPEVLRVVERMTAKSPTDRFQTPAEAAQALADFVKQAARKSKPAPDLPMVVDRGPAVARKTTVRSRRAALLAFGAAATAIAGAFGAVYLLSDRGGGAGENKTRETASGNTAPVVAPAVPPVATGRRPVVLFLLSTQFTGKDYIGVRQTLEQTGVDVRVASTGPCRTFDAPGIVVQPDVILPAEPLDAADYDALYIPGGQVQMLKNDSAVQDAVWRLIDDLIAADKPVAALGQGQGVLAIQGALVGRTVALNPSMAQIMPNGAWQRSPDRVCVDGPIVTGVDAYAAHLLAETLAAELRRRGAKIGAEPR